MSELAVIIVSFNTRELLAASLRSLQASLAASALEARLLVVENGSTDGSAAMLHADFPTVELLEPGDNLGFAGGNNFALRALGFGGDGPPPAEAPRWLWLLNPDTEVVGEAAGQLVAHLRAHPTVGAVGPLLRYGDGSFQHGAFHLPGLAQVALDLLPAPARLLESPLNGRYPRRLWEGGRAFPVAMLLGASLLVRAEAVAEVGLLDEGYFMYVEEVDWCRRLAQAGWLLHALPTATVIHHAGQSTQQFRERMFIALWRSRLRYYRKWHRAPYVAAVRALLRLGLAWQGHRLDAADPASAPRRRAYHEVAAL